MFSEPIKIILFIVINILVTTSESLSIGRIVGGNNIDISLATFTVQLIIQTPQAAHMCGGSLVTAFYVITAAHCVSNKEPSDITVIGGATVFNEGGIRQTVRDIHIRENSLPDIAVLKLNAALEGPNINTIQLCNTPIKEGDLVTVYGWGDTYFNGTSASRNVNARSDKHLKMVEVPVVNNEKCDVRESQDFYFCAGIPNQKDSAPGDSGGPAVLNGRLCGVVSSGYGIPPFGLYVNVNAMREFIENYIHSF